MSDLSHELEKMMSGELYDATRNETLLNVLTQCHERCFDYNQLRPSQTAERLDSGTSLFSTALHGALTVTFSENAFSITPFLDPASKE